MNKLPVVKYLIIIAAFLIPLAPHTHLLSKELPSMTMDILFVATCGLILLYPALKQVNRSREILILVSCWAAFALLTVISWMFSSSNNLSDLFAINTFAYFGAILITATAVNRETLELKKIFQAFYASAFVVAIIGIIQYFFFGFFINEIYISAYLSTMAENPAYMISDSLLSTFGNPNQAGIYLSMMLITGIASSYWGFNHRWQKVLWTVILVTAIILTQSRTAYICLTAGCLLYIFFSRKVEFKYLAYFLGAIIISSGIITQFLRHNGFQRIFDIQSTLQARFKIWEAAMEKFLSSPLVGVGPNPRIQLPGSNLPSIPIDNLYLTILCSYGLIGLTVLGIILYLIFKWLANAGKYNYNSMKISRGLSAALIILLISNLTGDFLFNTKITGSYLLLLGSFMASLEITRNNPSKILLVGNVMAFHLQRWGKSLAGKGFEIHILSPQHVPVQGCHVHEVKNNPGPILSKKGLLNYCKTLLEVEKQINKIGPDLVHIHGTFAFNNFAASYTTGPVVTSIWGSDIYRFALTSRRKYWLVKSTLSKADLITVPTREVAEDIEDNFNINKTHILPWGIDDNLFYLPHSRDEIRATKKQLQIPEGTGVVLSPRSLTPVYNIETIIESIPRVINANNNVYFCFLRGTGSAAYEEKMKKKAAELGIEGYTRWVSQMLPQEEMAKLLRASDVFISIPDTDNLGATILEGMACGSIPVVKRLKNYRCLFETGAVVYTIFETSPVHLASTILLALRKHTPVEKNADAALSLGTWQEAVDKTSEIYINLIHNNGTFSNKTT